MHIRRNLLWEHPFYRKPVLPEGPEIWQLGYYLTGSYGWFAPPQSIRHWFWYHLIEQRVRPLHLSIQLSHTFLQYFALLLLLLQNIYN